MKKAISTKNVDRATKPLQWNKAKQALLYLESEKQWHDLLMLAVGFYTGFRLSDIIELRYSDFAGVELDLSERKTTKQRSVPILPELRRIVSVCKKELNKKDTDYLFVRTRFMQNSPISKAAAITRIKTAFEFCGVKGKQLTGHTMRKTFALKYYEGHRERVGDYRALIALSKQLNHANVETTRLYIGIDSIVEQSVFDNWD